MALLQHPNFLPQTPHNALESSNLLLQLFRLRNLERLRRTSRPLIEGGLMQGLSLEFPLETIDQTRLLPQRAVCL